MGGANEILKSLAGGYWYTEFFCSVFQILEKCTLVGHSKYCDPLEYEKEEVSKCQTGTHTQTLKRNSPLCDKYCSVFWTVQKKDSYWLGCDKHA